MIEGRTLQSDSEDRLHACYNGLMQESKALLDIISLISQLTVFERYDFNSFLRKLVTLLNKIIDTDSCLIYFYDEKQDSYILIASKKPHTKLIGKISMKKGEGITGWVAEHMKTVVLPKTAYKDKRFKVFKELPEDLFEAFLSVPIVNKQGTIGVINLQNKATYAFSTDQVRLVEATVKLIATAFEKIVLQRQVAKLETKLEDRKIIERAKGLLMRERKIDEQEAFHIMRTEAMRKRKSIKEIAEAIILIYD